MLQTATVGRQSVVPVNKFLNVRCQRDGASGVAKPVTDGDTIIDANSNDLRSIQINYGKIYPRTIYETAFNNSSSKQYLIQRYEDTFTNSLSSFDVGQMESFASSDKAIYTFVPKTNASYDTKDQNGKNIPHLQLLPVFGFNTCDFLSRGLITCISVAKDSAAKNTDLVITVQYNQNASSNGGKNVKSAGLDEDGLPQLLIMSIYKKTAHVKMAQGAVVSVESILG